MDLYPDESTILYPGEPNVLAPPGQSPALDTHPLPSSLTPDEIVALNRLPADHPAWDNGTKGGGYPYPHVQPVRGFRDRLALALQGMQFPQADPRQPGAATKNSVSAFLSGFTGGYSHAGTERISEREKLNMALGQKAHEENARNIEASKAAAAEQADIRSGNRTLQRENDHATFLKSIETPKPPSEGTDETARFLAMDPAKQKAYLAAKNQLSPSNNPDTPDEWKNIADDIISGNQPPILASLGRSGKAVSWIRSYFHQKGYNYSRALTEWSAMQALTRNANTGQMANLQRAGSAVESAVTNLQDILNQAQTQIPRTLLPDVNQFTIGAAEHGMYGPAGQNIAKQLLAQFGILNQEVPTVLNGGYAPDESSRKTTAQMLSRFDSDPGISGTLKVLKDNVGYKTLAIKSLGVTIPGTSYGTESMPWAQPQPSSGTFLQQPTSTGTAPGVPPKSAAPPNSVYMESPDGKQRGWVPAGQKNQSLSNGWKLVPVK